MKKYMRIHEKDNVAVMLYDAKPEDIVILGELSVVLSEEIPYGHKVALQDLKKGDLIIKYNQPIGGARENIKRGEWVHVHNMSSLRGRSAG